METPAEQQDTAAPTGWRRPLPRLIKIILFRLLVAVSVGALFAWSISLREQRDTAAYCFLYVVVVGIPSLIISVGLIFRQRWAAWFAVAYDVVWITVWFSRVVTGLLLTSQYLFAYLFALVPMCFLWEAWVLLSEIYVSRRAAFLFDLAVSVAVLGGASSLVAPRLILLHRVEPLVRYARGHWVDLPSNLWCYRGSLYRDPRTGYTVVSFEKERAAFVPMPEPSAVRFMAKDLGRGKWLIPANPSMKGRDLAVMCIEYLGGGDDAVLALEARGYLKTRDPRPDDASNVAILREPDLLRDGPRLAFGTFPSWNTPAVFRSPDSQALYYVDDGGLALLVRPQKSIVVR